ncbi:MAG: hypothetical protein Unbinned5213contig1001_30 [Prokaryotic dsDNA virus sp.]|nr:MAG: hypothetical protein Unbinned5213contig1001_30 [Prokaryotic dsDNA virus sp.]
MSFKVGNKFAGSRKGIPNKTTKQIREAFKLLVEDNLPNMKVWLSDIAEDDPEKALNIILKMSEFIVPKLQRQEIEHEVRDKQVIINVSSTEDE